MNAEVTWGRWCWGQMRAETSRLSGVFIGRSEWIHREKGSPEVCMVNEEEKGIVGAVVVGSLSDVTRDSCLLGFMPLCNPLPLSAGWT